jgi:hypothetical protein
MVGFLGYLNEYPDPKFLISIAMQKLLLYGLAA